MTTAPERFAAWLASYRKVDKFGRSYAYHPRSDAHSVELCYLILEDLVARCPVLLEQGRRGEVAYGINAAHTWADGKSKTLDFAVGIPKTADSRPNRIAGLPRALEFSDVLISCEAKSVMTEHGKSQPRVFDELTSSHGIMHRGRPDAIAAGITVVNIASTFVSPTRNQFAGGDAVISKHRQPHVTERMVRHLRGLTIRDAVEGIGFDAYSTVVVECDNQGHGALWTKPPAPQPGDPDHYETFIERIARFYAERFNRLPS
jgi:hypothetical protein